MPSNTERNLLEELREAIETGNFRINDDGSGSLRGAPTSAPVPSQETASPLVAAAIKLPDLEPPPKPRTPSPIIEKTPPKPIQKEESDESSEEESSEDEVSKLQT